MLLFSFSDLNLAENKELSGLIVLGFSYVLKLAHDAFKKFVDQKKAAKEEAEKAEQEQEKVKKAHLVNAVLQIELDHFVERARLEVKSDHVSLYRFHNGDYWVSNMSIDKMSMTSESPAEAGYKSKSQNLLMSNFPHMRIGINEQLFYYVTRDNHMDWEFGRIMHQRHYLACVCTQLEDRYKAPLGLLVFAWTARPPAKEEIDSAKIEEYKQDIMYALSAP